MTVSAATTDVSGVKLAHSLALDNHILTLNGAGLRTLALFKVYVVGLYTSGKLTRADDVINSTSPQCVELVLKRDVDASMVLGSFHDAIKLNVPPAELQALAPQFAQLDPSIRTIGRIKEGDRLRMEFRGDGSTRVLFNGEERETIQSAALTKALLGIWLGRKPVQDSLKKALLGG